MPTEPLLMKLPQATEFIDRALASGGNILVHCNAGYSRSPSVVAAYLMQTQGMSRDGALVFLRKKCSAGGKTDLAIDPNRGFMEQLNTLESRLWMEQRRKAALEDAQSQSQRPLSPRSSRVQRFFQQAAPPGGPATEASAPEPTAPSTTSQAAISEPHSSATAPVPIDRQEVDREMIDCSYRCRICGRELFREAQILPHEVHDKHFNRLNKKSAAGKDECTAWFIEQQPWMGALDQLDGVLECYHCHKKVGTYNWSGMQCSCGTWVTPAFSMLKSKVDARPVYAPAASVVSMAFPAFLSLAPQGGKALVAAMEKKEPQIVGGRRIPQRNRRKQPKEEDIPDSEQLRAIRDVIQKQVAQLSPEDREKLLQEVDRKAKLREDVAKNPMNHVSLGRLCCCCCKTIGILLILLVLLVFWAAKSKSLHFGMEEEKNYFKVLGLEPDASPLEIRRAYRKLAAQYHPDKNPGCKDCVKKFHEISAAFEALTQGDHKVGPDRYGDYHDGTHGKAERDMERERARREEEDEWARGQQQHQQEQQRQQQQQQQQPKRRKTTTR
ncbi:putative Dual specificity phosphatase [Paratrimastix pyriformis]|uniref:protein-tyrosine-phosphatase n=1 Tax=Paratrimastix pyriformis TaxID=342808 RepID=A0ABQ8UYB5_9EUKA|nr:putative Dual specificity phosphatase [Paratrimastix pyriformis]